MPNQTTELESGIKQSIGKPMSTAFILMMLGRISMRIDPEVKDNSAALKAIVGLDVKTARMRYSVNATTQDINKTLNAVDHMLDELGNTEITQGIQQNYLHHFAPLKAEASDRAQEKTTLLKQLSNYSSKLKEEAKSISGTEQSPEALRNKLEDMQRAQKDLQQQVEKLGTNEKSLFKRLKKIRKDIYQSAVSSAGVIPKGIERPEPGN